MNRERIREILSTIYHNALFRHAVKFGAICLALLLLMDWIIMPIYTKHGEAIEVPNVTAMPVDEAVTKLQEREFEGVTGEERYSSQYPSGFVLEQTPHAFAKVKSGRRIYLVVSRGERRVSVPSLIDRSERDAQLLLARADLVLGEVNYEYSANNPDGTIAHPDGTIMFQSLAENTQVLPGTRVSITVSAGSVPNEFIVPAVDGRPFDDAAKMLRKAGLAVGSVRYEDVEDLLPETVIRQGLESGTKVEKGTKVDLVVSRLPSSSQPR
jgi:serine/threonine-protein kinase